MGLLPLIMEHMGLIPLSVLSSLCLPLIHVIFPPWQWLLKGMPKAGLINTKITYQIPLIPINVLRRLELH